MSYVRPLVLACNHWPGQPRCEICGMGMTPNAHPASARERLVLLLDEGGYEWEDVHDGFDAIEAAAVAAERARLTAGNDHPASAKASQLDMAWRDLLLACLCPEGQAVREHRPAIEAEARAVLFETLTEKHEPRIAGSGYLECTCGWYSSDHRGESYFDHIGEAP